MMSANLAIRAWAGIVALMGAVALAGSPSASAAQFRWADSRAVSTMEPHYVDVFMIGFLSNMYEPLMAVESDGTLSPQLSTSWEQVEPSRWRFKLRQGVTFHDGDKFDAGDVVFTFERAQQTQAITSAIKAIVQSVVRVDDYTVDVITKVPDPVLPRALISLLIMSKEWAEKNNAVTVVARGVAEEGYTNRHVNGTGPFTLANWNPGVSVELKPNPNWWGGKRSDNLDSAVMSEISSSSTQLAALLAKDIDLMVSVPPAMIDRVKGAQGVKLLNIPGLITYLLGWDLWRDELLESSVKGKNPFKDPRVQRAFYLAIDVEAINSKILRGEAFPTELTVAPGVEGHIAELNVREKPNIPRARQLLAEAGYPNGFEIGFDCPAATYPSAEQICEAISVMLAQIGIKTKLAFAQRAPYFAKLQSPRYEGTFYYYSSATASFDSFTHLDRILRSRNLEARTGLSNSTGWSDKEFDSIVDRIGEEKDVAKRTELYKKAWTRVREGLPFIPLFQLPVTWAMRDNIDIIADPVNRVVLRHLKMK